MIDTSSGLMTHLLAQTALSALVGTAMHTPRIPNDFAPPGLVFFVRSGFANPDIEVDLAPSYQFDAYGRTALEARTIYRALYDVLSDINAVTVGGVHIFCAIEETHGIDLIDPKREWPLVRSFWEIQFI